MSSRVNDCTIRHALISIIGDETHTHTYIDIQIRRKVSFHLLFNLHSKKTHDGCDLALKIKRKRREREKKMKINYCCLYYCSYVVLFLSSVTKTSEDKRMVTDHCYLTSLVVLNMDENDDDYDIEE